MSAIRFLLLMKSAGARFVGRDDYSTAADSQAVDLSSFQVGDFVFITATTPDNAAGSFQVTGGDGSWSDDIIPWTALGYDTVCFSKKLTSGDLAGVTVAWVSSGAPTGLIVSVVGYRGAAAATLRSANEGSGSLTLSGFTKATGCRRIVTIAVSRDASATMTAPASFFDRGDFAGTFFVTSIADAPPSRYVNGANVVWGDTGGFPVVGFLYELT